MMRPPLRKKSSQQGIALFMVISTLAILSVIIAELTYTTQVNARMAFNSIDNLKAYYLAKAGYKLSIVRLNAYLQVGKFLDDQGKDSPIKGALPKDVLEKIWSFPFMYPIPVIDKMSEVEKDAVKKFQKESNLTGSFTANISSESNRLNLNNLLVKKVTPTASSSSSSSGQPAAAASSASSEIEVDQRPAIEQAIQAALDSKRDSDREFFEEYRSVQAKDIVDAILAYLTPDVVSSNLPGFKAPAKAKEAPLYSLTELHLVPGLEDNLYDVIAPLFTVFNTPGINVNSADKKMFQALFPDLSRDELDALINKRDDKDVGKPWETEDDFWKSFQEVAANAKPDDLKEKLKKANIRIITTEESFKISVLATVGLSTKRLVAHVILNPSALKKAKPKAATGQGNQQGTNAQNQPQDNSQNSQQQKTADASHKTDSGINLIYWRIL